VCEVAAAPISSNVQETFSEPSKVFPVLPIVTVLAVANLVAVADFPLEVMYPLSLVNEDSSVGVPLKSEYFPVLATVAKSPFLT
jgi:hypothetical protein